MSRATTCSGYNVAYKPDNERPYTKSLDSNKALIKMDLSYNAALILNLMQCV